MSDGEQGGGGAAAALLGGDGGAGAGGAGDAGAGGAAGGAGDAGAGGGAGGGAGAGGAGEVGGAADPDWYGNLSAEAGEGGDTSNRDWIKARGAKTLDDVVKGFRDTQRAFHDKGMVKVPGEGAAPEEVAAFRKAIGVPDSVEGYAFEGPKDEAGNALPLADGLISAVLQSALKNGLPADAVKAMLADVIAADLDGQRAALGDQQSEARAWIKEHGVAGAAKLAAINTAARVIGLSDDEVLSARSVWGARRAMEVFALLGEGLSEDTILSGGQARFGVTGSEAQAQLTARKSDPAWAKKAATAGTPENAEYVRLRDASAVFAGQMAEQF